MKLLYYSPHAQLSLSANTGYGTHMREMIAAFREVGWEVDTLIAGDMQATGKQSEVVAKAPAYRNWKKIVPPYIWQTGRDISLMRRDRYLQGALIERIEQSRPDVVYERIAYLHTSGIRACAQSGVPHIAEVNAPFPEERVAFSGSSALLRRAQKALRDSLLGTTLVSTVSSAMAQYLTQIEPAAESKMVVIPNCIHPSHAGFSTGLMESLRVKLNPDRKLVVGFVGSIFPYHGVDILIEAFAASGCDGLLLIVGDGSGIPELKSLAHRLGISGQVLFTGSVPHSEVYAYIDLMDICCMAKSNWYGSPVKIFEYGLLGKAVIAPDTIPVRDVMDESTGIIAAPDMESVKGAIQRLAADAGLRTTLGKAWQQKVLKEHTWLQAAKTITDLCA